MASAGLMLAVGLALIVVVIRVLAILTMERRSRDSALRAAGADLWPGDGP